MREVKQAQNTAGDLLPNVTDLTNDQAAHWITNMGHHMNVTVGRIMEMIEIAGLPETQSVALKRRIKLELWGFVDLMGSRMHGDVPYAPFDFTPIGVNREHEG